MYFKTKIPAERQNSLLDRVRLLKSDPDGKTPYTITLLESNVPDVYKNIILGKIGEMEDARGESSEYSKLKHWVESAAKIPFGNIVALPVHIDDGIEKCTAFMESAHATLEAAVYGLQDAKMQILQVLGQMIANPLADGTAIAIHGPPGTGKTSLVKNGISKILGRPFELIALGGATDSSHLDGHSYTYEGSMWGRVVQAIMDAKCMNPVFYFDELDKISDTPKGEEIIGLLTHLIDTTQNDQYQDKYFVDFKLDLSKCLFIFSYNDESKINPILKDRMYKISTKGYTSNQKNVIGRDYMLPRIRDQMNLQTVTIPDETMKYIVDHKCGTEDGVRNLKRCLETIYSKLNLQRMAGSSSVITKDMPAVTFPCTVDTRLASTLIGSSNATNSSISMMYI